MATGNLAYLQDPAVIVVDWIGFICLARKLSLSFVSLGAIYVRQRTSSKLVSTFIVAHLSRWVERCSDMSCCCVQWRRFICSTS
eukprot:2387439-Rhodomonas_salina.4